MVEGFLIPFGIGVASSIVAAILFSIIRLLMKAGPKVRLAGNWFEFVPGSEDRQFTFGKIYFDRVRQIYAFDGTNYFNDGSAFCHFNTIASHLDKHNRRFFYTFEARVDGSNNVVYFGFGVVNLTVDTKGQLVPVDGHYVSADIDGVPMTHSVQRTDRIYRKDQSIAAFLHEIKR